MKIQVLTLYITALVMLCVGCTEEAKIPVSIVPQPQSIDQEAGSFILTSSSTISYNRSDARLTEIAAYTSALISEYSSVTVKESTDKADIRFKITELESSNPEAYRLNIDDSGVEITANSYSGIFYGVQTLRQLIEPNSSSIEVTLPKLTISDAPTMKWRGLHLDVSRHFFSKDDIIRFIDIMSMYKINKFHWHLTDDQGWRIDIKAYPKLTTVGAWRKSVGFKSNQESGLDIDDGSPYGGYYTQKEVKEIVKYAQQRAVEIIPEIEMPGHSIAALVAYPELACDPDKKLELRTTGGVSDGVYCAGKEGTFKFLEDVLTEVIALFPSEYIHIGGDEAPKRNWQACEHCQKRIVDENLNDEHELQSYFIRRIEKFLNSNNRKLVGWDEILEGGISKTATIMSWRGITPGVEAAEIGNEVIMTPGTPMYISRPQSINPVTKHKGDSHTMRDIYEFSPIPEELSTEAAKNIIGIQACHWSEGTPDIKILMYKEYPRAIALAELGWTAPENREWNSFYSRVQKNKSYLDFHGVEYGQSSYDVRINITPNDDHTKISARFTSEVPGDIYYTLDGTEPTKESSLYSEAVDINKSGSIKARMYREDGSAARVASQTLFYHKAIGKSVDYTINYSSKHNGGGKYGLTNGLLKKWQGFEKRDIDLTLDLGRVTEISSIKTSWWYDIKDWVFKPLQVTYEISEDGKEFKEILTYTPEQLEGVYEKGILPIEKMMEPTDVRYIRLRAKSIMQNPQWHDSAGAATWIFVDEIVVD